MKRIKLTALLLSLCLTACLLLSGCHLNIRLNDENGSDINIEIGESAIESELEKAESDLESRLNKTESELESLFDETAPPAAAAVYTMQDVKALKNTGHFGKNTLEHIFDGTINSKGKATGYHYSRISDAKGEIIAGTESKRDSRGVFTAKVKVSGVKKNGFSSFYPESWTPQQVVDAINEAYEDALSDKSNPHGSLWIGYSGDLEIDMYLDSNKKITTAYPIYEGDN